MKSPVQLDIIRYQYMDYIGQYMGVAPMVEARRTSAAKNAPSSDPRLKTTSGVRRLGGYGPGVSVGAARATLIRGSGVLCDAAPWPAPAVFLHYS